MKKEFKNLTMEEMYEINGGKVYDPKEEKYKRTPETEWINNKIDDMFDWIVRTWDKIFK